MARPTATRIATALAIMPVVAGLVLAPTPAKADWRPGYGHYYGGPRYYGGYRGPGAGAIVGGALLGLGVGALLAAPPAYYAPPPVVYAPPPAYYPPPGYAPAYYPPPGYYVR